jgi:hypothetical protein
MVAEVIARRVYRRFATPTLALISVNLVGMLGYNVIGGSQVSWLDCLLVVMTTPDGRKSLEKLLAAA